MSQRNLVFLRANIHPKTHTYKYSYNIKKVLEIFTLVVVIFILYFFSSHGYVKLFIRLAILSASQAFLAIIFQQVSVFALH